MNTTITNHFNPAQSAQSQRAKSLLSSLSNSGTGETRAKETKRALDTLVREHRSTPEVSFGRLAQVVGKRASLPITKADIYKMGLEAVASGAAGSGAALAALAIKFVSTATSDEKLRVAETAVKSLKSRDDLQQTMKLESAMKPGWFNPGFTAEQRQGIADTLLMSSAGGFKPESTAHTLFNTGYKTGTHGTVRQTKRVAQGLLTQLGTKTDAQEAKTYKLAKQVQEKTFGTASSVVSAFTEDLPHTLEGRATRLLQLRGRGDSGSRMSDWDIPQDGMMRGLGSLVDEAKSEGNQGWKILALSQAAGDVSKYRGNPITMMKMGLTEFLSEESDSSPQGISKFTSSLLKDCNGLATYHGPHGTPADLFHHKLAPTLQSVVSDPSWKAAFQVLDASTAHVGGARARVGQGGMGDWGDCCSEALNTLADLPTGQSPFLTACHAMTSFVEHTGNQSRYRGMTFGHEELKQVWTVAEGLTQDPAEITAIRAARIGLADSGLDAAKEILAEAL